MKITKQRLEEIIKEELGSISEVTQGLGVNEALDTLYQTIDLLLNILDPETVVQELEAQIKDIRGSQ